MTSPDSDVTTMTPPPPPVTPAGVGRGRPRGDAGRRGQPRARERARAHVVGGLLDGHARSRRWGRHHHRGHAAVREGQGSRVFTGMCDKYNGMRLPNALNVNVNVNV